MSVVRTVGDDERRARLADRHRLLAGRRSDDVATIVDDLVALHSSDPATVYLSAVVRMIEPALGAVDAALYERRTIVRHHAMRRTMWVMTPDVTRRAHAAATARIADIERQRTVAALAETDGIADPERWLDEATDEIVRLLGARGPMSAREIGRALPHLVIPIVFGAGTRNPATLNAHTKVLQGAGFDGTLVRTRPTGAWTSSEYTWAAAGSWLPEPTAGREPRRATAELLEHWLHRFGPATTTDVRWWFGWTAKVTRLALADIGAAQVELDSGATGWLAADDLDEVDGAEPWVRLLPGLDATTMGWKQRGWYLDDEMTPRLFDRFGNAGPTVWADGRVVGGWVQRPDGRVAVELLAPLAPDRLDLLDEAARQIEEVLGDTVVKPRFPSPNQAQLLISPPWR